MLEQGQAKIGLKSFDVAPMVGWLIPNSPATADSESLAATDEKLLHSAQSCSLFIFEWQFCKTRQFIN